jgi:hypothetical protein
MAITTPATPSTQPLVCENCDAALGRLDDAFVWLDRPVCRRCFKRLSASRSVKYRGVWMPLALAGLVAAAVAVAALVTVLMRPPGRGATSSSSSSSSPGSGGEAGLAGATTAPTTAPTTLPVAAPSSGGGAAEQLARRLFNTRWEWGADDTVVFRPDGTVENANWTGRGLDTRWSAVDDHTVVFVIARGRDHQLAAVLRFNKEFTRWNGTNFEGGHTANNRRLDANP